MTSAAASGQEGLLRRLRAGDEPAFEELVRSLSGRLWATARRILRSDDDAGEAVQETFVSIFRSIGQFEGNSSLATWAHRILVNHCLQKLRWRKRVDEESLDDLLPRFREDGHQLEPSVPWGESDLVERIATRELVSRLIRQLPESYRTVLVLRDLEQWSPQETAEALGITRVAVKVRLHRARQALRQLLDPFVRGNRSCATT